jgi:hypothetical protein
MSNLHNERYDEIKSLLKKTKLIFEQTQIDVAKDIEDNIDSDADAEYETAEVKNPQQEKSKEDIVQKYRVSGGILAIHGKDRTDVEINSDDKLAFQQSMDEFVDEVSDLVDFNVLNIYTNNVQWSGYLIDDEIEFIFTIGEDSGIYINADYIKIDQEFLTTLTKLQQFYQKFKSKWGKVIASRKKTK